MSWLSDLFSRRRVGDAPTPVATPTYDASGVTAVQVWRPAPGMDGLQNVAAGLGTERDKRFYSQYVAVAQQSPAQLSNVYRTSWLAGRVVDTVADDMTRAGWALSWDGYDDNDEGGAEVIEEAEEEIDLQGNVLRAAKWGRLHGGGALLMDIRGEDPAKPLNLNTIRKGSLTSLYELDRTTVFFAGEIDREPGPHLGRPLYYLIGDNTHSAPRVHWSRLVIFRGRILPRLEWQRNGYWDDSELTHVIESTQDYDATRAAIASMVWEANVDVLKMPELLKQLGTQAGESKITNRLLSAHTIKSFNRTLVINSDEEYTQKQIAFGGVVDVLRQFMVDVCGAADIPMTRLFGQSAAGFNATGDNDVRNYYDHVAAKQKSHVRPQLKQLYDVVVRSTLGKMPRHFKIKMNPLWQVSETERTQIEKTRAERDKLYIDMGVATEGLIARQLKDDNTYRAMEDEDVELAEELAKAPPVLPGATGKTAPPPAGETPPEKDDAKESREEEA